MELFIIEEYFNELISTIFTNDTQKRRKNIRLCTY